MGYTAALSYQPIHIVPHGRVHDTRYSAQDDRSQAGRTILGRTILFQAIEADGFLLAFVPVLVRHRDLYTMRDRERERKREREREKEREKERKRTHYYYDVGIGA